MSDPRRPSPEVIALIDGLIDDTHYATAGHDPDNSAARTALESHIAGLEASREHWRSCYGNVCSEIVDAAQEMGFKEDGDCVETMANGTRALRSALQAVVDAWDAFHKVTGHFGSLPNDDEFDDVVTPRFVSTQSAITAARTLLSRDTTKNE